MTATRTVKVPAKRWHNARRRTKRRGWLKRIASWLGFSRQPEPKRVEVRSRWESARPVDRMNETHWLRAKGQAINLDLIDDLVTLRQRCEHEVANNPFVAGVIKTSQVSVIGQRGPKLVAQTEDREWAKAFGKVWSDWWAAPDVNGSRGPLSGSPGMAGADFLKLAHRGMWSAGEYFWQLCTLVRAEARLADEGWIVWDLDFDRSVGTRVHATEEAAEAAARDHARRKDPIPDRIELRLHAIAARRVDTPFIAPRRDVILGVRTTQSGRVLSYFVQREDFSDPFFTQHLKFDEIPAGFMIHGFSRDTEPGALRGVPLLATSLDTIADLRDYDQEVLDAARQAADYGAVLVSQHPEAPFFELGDEVVGIERRSLQAVPSGWDVKQLKPEQPATGYVDFRTEKHREIARQANMPLMMIRLDSSGHNFSSARFDGQLHNRTTQCEQRDFERQALNRLVALVEREAVLKGMVRPRPADLTYAWRWDQMPHVDPTKEANAERIRLGNRTLTLADALVPYGLELEETLDQLALEKQMLEERGLTEIQPVSDEDVAIMAIEEAATATANGEPVEIEAEGVDGQNGTRPRWFNDLIAQVRGPVNGSGS